MYFTLADPIYSFVLYDEIYVCVFIYIYIYIYIFILTAYRRQAIYFYVTDFPITSNWNIVCNTNTHHVLQYCYDIVINNIYTQKSVSLKPICLDATYG